MVDDAEAVRVLRRSALQHDRGIICPAYMWGEVARVLDGPDPRRVLALASADCQASLRRIYRDRPWSLQGEGRDEASRRVVEAIEAWCLAPDAEPGAAADGGGM